MHGGCRAVAAPPIDCDARGAVELGLRLQRAAARSKFAWGTASISVGSAAGAAGEAPEEVAKAADRALYTAKDAAKALLLAGSRVASSIAAAGSDAARA
jgi:GGDEF domain-containing protein